MKKATRQHTKSHNRQLVLKTIYQHGQISRADIARATRLTRPTVSTIVADLLEDDLVQEVGVGPSAGGKPPILLDVAGDLHCIVAVDLGSQFFRGALVNLRGELIERLTLANDQQGEGALQQVYVLVDRLVEVAQGRALGIGIGTPGVIDPEQGVVLRAVNLGWSDLPLEDLVSARYGLPVYLANDSHAAALAEHTYGDRQNGNNLIVVKVGRGIGAGIVLQGRPYYGDGFGAGEIGHFVVAEDGPLCGCGNHGCLETVLGTRALLEQAGAFLPDHPTVSSAAEADSVWTALLQALQANSIDATKLVAQAGRYLGISLAAFVAALNVQQIVIAGRVVDLGENFLAAARRAMGTRVLPAMAGATTVSYTRMGTDIVLLGAAALVLHNELGIV